MEITLQEIVFYVVAAAIAVFSVLAVTTGKILRAATSSAFYRAYRIYGHAPNLYDFNRIHQLRFQSYAAGETLRLGWLCQLQNTVFVIGWYERLCLCVPACVAVDVYLGIFRDVYKLFFRARDCDDYQ